MDGATAALKEKLNRLLKEAAQVSVALDRAEGTIAGVPHYSVIEAGARDWDSSSVVRSKPGGGIRGRESCAPWKGVDLQWVQFPPGNWVAPAGSYRSGGGGDETVGAFETDVSL